MSEERDLKEPESSPELLQVASLPEAGPPAPQRKGRWGRRRGIAAGIVLLVVTALAVGLYYWASSAAFEDSMRRKVVAELEDATGGRVEIDGFRWDLLHLRVEATGITIHGLEAADEAPYLHVEKLRAQISILNLFTIGSPARVILREAQIVEPEFHLIVYSDGSTNQPHPRHPSSGPSKPALDTLFNAEIGRLWVERGTLHIADRVYPLDLAATDANLLLTWMPDAAGARADDKWAGSYRVQVEVGELAFAQGKYKPVSSRVDASLELFHDSARLDSLRLAALGQTLTVSGQLADFAHPAWQAMASGGVDLRILAPYMGFEFTRSGVVSLRASASGKEGSFEASGDLASNAIHYQDTVVDAQTSRFSARFRADMHTLLVSQIRVGIAQGGEVDGEFEYANWLDSTPTPKAQAALKQAHRSWPMPTGRVSASLRGVTLDTILDMLARRQYRRLGLDAVVSGPATAGWTGLGKDLAIGGQLGMTPSSKPVAGEVPVQGAVDAAYHVDSGSVKVNTLTVNLPHGSVTGNGSLGVYPITRESAMNLDFQSSDLSDFDGVLRALEVVRGNRIGSAALPVALHGKAEAHFQGQLNGSWLAPHIEGRLTASDIGIEVPVAAETGVSQADTDLKYLHWDSIDLDGSYSPSSIVIRHGVLHRGLASLTLQGHLDADDPTYRFGDKEAEFDEHSVVNLKASAADFPLEELLPLAGVTASVKGTLNAQVDVNGPLNGLTGSGTVNVDKASAYGETIEQVRAAGSVAGGQVKITSLTAQQSARPDGGRLTATGSYDLNHRSFQVDARGVGIDLGSLQELKRAGVQVEGKLGFTAIGNGLVSDPHVVTKATLSGMSIGGTPVSDLLVSATMREHAVSYDLDSHQPSGDFTAHGETGLTSDYPTQASLQFSKFDVGALLKLLKVTGINGQSALEGTANVSGPLAHPERLRGEATLNQLALDVEGVHLASKGKVHATLLDGVARLDPLEITGEDTDLKLHGSLAVTGKQQLDLVAEGSVNMRLAETLDSDLTASGVTSFQMEAHGPLSSPVLQGKVEFQNAAIALQDFPNGLSQIKGTLEFIQNRLEVRSLTAMSGGGQLSVSGYLGFQHGLYADLSAMGKSIRIRYPEGVSSLADANLRLQGPQNNLLLSGDVLVTKFAINSDLDVTALATTAGGVQAIVSPDAPSNHLRLDVRLRSAPQLNFQNAYAKLAGDVDLHLRGTLASPTLLGKISLTEGSTEIGGTKYELQRGDIVFNNPVRIEPNIDIDATARVEDYDITLGLHGSADKPRLTYRSEPPLTEADIIALLALGRTQDEQAAYAQQQQQGGDNPMTDALLGGALNATVSNRVQKLFGTGAIKVDPNFIGSLGNSSARVTVVEQIGNNLTFTYASNVNTTTQQLIQAEIAINRHVSVLVTQDESGIFSVVFKARRQFR